MDAGGEKGRRGSTVQVEASMIELDDIWREAKAHILVERKAKAAAQLRKTAEPEKASTQALFLDAKNWTRTRGIALIHEETETLLGNFSEYVHNSVAGCRKLIREETPIAVSASERVAGSWWLGEARRPEPKQVWHEQRPCIIHLHLDKLFVHSPICELTVHLSYGGIARVELTLDTQFAAEEGHGEQLLFLPAGTNVLEVMSLDSKLAVRKELGI